MDWRLALNERRTNAGVDVDGLEEELGTRLALMLLDPRLRNEVLAESGLRSHAKQLDLYTRWKAGTYNVKVVAYPGTSKHERGKAADLDIINTSALTWDDVHAVGADYGLCFPIYGEPWHTELDPKRAPLPYAQPPAPEPPKEEIEMAFLVQADDGDIAVFTTDGVTKAWVRDGNAVANLAYLGIVKSGEHGPIRVLRSALDSFALIGPAPVYPADYTGPRTTR